MSAFSEIAIPGKIPTVGTGKRIKPEDLFAGEFERAKYKRLLDGVNDASIAPDVSVKKVSVRIFDFSDKAQVKEYEKLWKELLEKTARNEVIVEAQKDLVRRSDGTSYWMKYVEYVEFGDASEDKKKKKETANDA